MKFFANRTRIQGDVSAEETLGLTMRVFQKRPVRVSKETCACVKQKLFHLPNKISCVILSDANVTSVCGKGPLLRWGWVFLERTRILSGIQEARD